MRSTKPTPAEATSQLGKRKASSAHAARTPVPQPGTAAEMLRLRAATERFTARRARDRLPHRIDTRRLVLRAPIRGDVPALVKLADNPNIARWLARLPSPYTRADAIGFVEIISQRPDERPYAITLDGEFMGVVGISFFAERGPELGYWLGEPYWGKGIMSEAVAGLLEAAGATGVFPVIGARALVENAASLHVLEKAGFERTGEAIEVHETFGERQLVLLSKELKG